MNKTDGKAGPHQGTTVKKNGRPLPGRPIQQSRKIKIKIKKKRAGYVAEQKNKKVCSRAEK